MAPKKKTKVPPALLIAVLGVGAYLLYREHQEAATAQAASSDAGATTGAQAATTPYGQLYGGGYGPPAVQSSTTSATTTPITEIWGATTTAQPDTAADATEVSNIITAQGTQPNATAAANNQAATTQYVNTVGATQASAYELWVQQLDAAWPGGLNSPPTPAQQAWLAANPAPVAQAAA